MIPDVMAKPLKHPPCSFSPGKGVEVFQGRFFNKVQCAREALLSYPWDYEVWVIAGVVLGEHETLKAFGKTFSRIQCFVQAKLAARTKALPWVNLAGEALRGKPVKVHC